MTVLNTFIHKLGLKPGTKQCSASPNCTNRTTFRIESREPSEEWLYFCHEHVTENNLILCDDIKTQQYDTNWRTWVDYDFSDQRHYKFEFAPCDLLSVIEDSFPSIAIFPSGSFEYTIVLSTELFQPSTNPKHETARPHTLTKTIELTPTNINNQTPEYHLYVNDTKLHHYNNELNAITMHILKPLQTWITREILKPLSNKNDVSGVYCTPLHNTTLETTPRNLCTHPDAKPATEFATYSFLATCQHCDTLWKQLTRHILTSDASFPPKLSQLSRQAYCPECYSQHIPPSQIQTPTYISELSTFNPA